MTNPWGRQELEATHAVLLALTVDPLDRATLARKAACSDEAADAALRALLAAQLAIQEEGGFELSGPLSWFGSFENALIYLRRKGLVARDRDGSVHLYLCDVRVKGRHPPGDPRNETVSVFACGRTAANAQAAPAAAPDCAACSSALKWVPSGLHRP